MKDMKNIKPKLPPIWKRYTKEEFQYQIEKNYGIITLICNILDCSYTQFYSAIKHWELDQVLKDAKTNLVSEAENVILNCMKSQNENIALKSAEITLKSKIAKDWNNTQSQEIKINPEDKSVIIHNIFGT